MTRTYRQALRRLPLTMQYARENGWQYEHGSGKHARLTKPGQRSVILPRSPSDHRADLNARAYLRRADRGQKASG